MLFCAKRSGTTGTALVFCHAGRRRAFLFLPDCQRNICEKERLPIAITSRIKTDEVIGHSSSGKAVTEIGYSGVGQLGEVVTFADGTQRVEIIMRNGHSGWLTTSGRLTLDEICTRNGAPGSLAGKLTPEESAIRHYSDPMADMDQSLKNSFGSYVSRYSV